MQIRKNSNLLSKIEKQLIHNFPTEMNKPEKTQNIEITHTGDVPQSIKLEEK